MAARYGLFTRTSRNAPYSMPSGSLAVPIALGGLAVYVMSQNRIVEHRQQPIPIQHLINLPTQSRTGKQI